MRESDLIVEAADGHVFAELVKKTFAAGKDLMVISVGALLDHPAIMADSRAVDAGVDSAARAPRGAAINRKRPTGNQRKFLNKRSRDFSLDKKLRS